MEKKPAHQPPGKPADATWMPVFYSTVVYPGIGQWQQHRRQIGVFYATVFTIMAIMFTWILVVYLGQVIPILRDALSGHYVAEREIPPLNIILKPFGAVLFVYFGNTIDVLRGRMQLLRKQQQHVNG